MLFSLNVGGNSPFHILTQEGQLPDAQFSSLWLLLLKLEFVSNGLIVGCTVTDGALDFAKGGDISGVSGNLVVTHDFLYYSFILHDASSYLLH